MGFTTSEYLGHALTLLFMFRVSEADGAPLVVTPLGGNPEVSRMTAPLCTHSANRPLPFSLTLTEKHKALPVALLIT
jgi:hypothetical protein